MSTHNLFLTRKNRPTGAMQKIVDHLLAHPGATAPELSAALDIPTSSVCNTLGNLSMRFLVTRLAKDGPRARYRLTNLALRALNRGGDLRSLGGKRGPEVPATL